MDKIKKNLFDLFQIDKLPIDKGIETLDRLASLVFQAVLVRTLPLLSEEELTEYEKITDSGEADLLFKFLTEKIPEFETIIQEEAENLRAELAGEFDAAGI